MSRKNKWEKVSEVDQSSSDEIPEANQEETVQNSAPVIGWQSFDHFWSMFVKGGNSTIKNSCIAHLKSRGIWEDQSKWLDGVEHFGVPIEK